MSTAPQLTTELLEALESRWQAMNAPVLRHLQPGLGEPEIRQLSASFGVPPPDEARVLWRWRDGTRHGAPTVEADVLGSGLALCSLAASIETARWERAEAAGMARAGSTPRWRPSWLPVATSMGGDHIVIDCAAPGPLTPVYFFDREASGLSPGAGSLGQLVQWWIEALDAGTASHDERSGGWRYRWERLPADRAATRLT